MATAKADSTASHGKLRFVALWMTGALLSFVVAAVSIRTLSALLNPFEINVCRTGGGLAALMVPIIFSRRSRRMIRIGDMPSHAFRNFVHAASGLLWTAAIAVLPLSTVFSIEFSAPAWAALLSVPVLGERIGGRAMVGLLTSLVGVLIVLRPTANSFTVAALLPLGAAFGLGLSALLTRKLTRSYPIFAIVFWMMCLQLLINASGALMTAYLSPRSVELPAADVGAAVLLALSGLSSQFCLANALRIAESSTVMSLDFLRVPLITWVGLVFYDEPIDSWVFVGAATIAAGILFVLSPPARAKAPTWDRQPRGRPAYRA